MQLFAGGRVQSGAWYRAVGSYLQGGECNIQCIPKNHDAGILESSNHRENISRVQVLRP
jgi:hypothetical protein